MVGDSGEGGGCGGDAPVWGEGSGEGGKEVAWSPTTGMLQNVLVSWRLAHNCGQVAVHYREERALSAGVSVVGPHRIVVCFH